MASPPPQGTPGRMVTLPPPDAPVLLSKEEGQEGVEILWPEDPRFGFGATHFVSPDLVHWWSFQWCFEVLRCFW